MYTYAHNSSVNFTIPYVPKLAGLGCDHIHPFIFRTTQLQSRFVAFFPSLPSVPPCTPLELRVSLSSLSTPSWPPPPFPNNSPPRLQKRVRDSPLSIVVVWKPKDPLPANSHTTENCVPGSLWEPRAQGLHVTPNLSLRFLSRERGSRP